MWHFDDIDKQVNLCCLNLHIFSVKTQGAKSTEVEYWEATCVQLDETGKS
jgi:hypothetical protein